MDEDKKARQELIRLVAEKTVQLCVNHELTIDETEEAVYAAISIAKKSTKAATPVKCCRLCPAFA
jgi:hypothetical protein